MATTQAVLCTEIDIATAATFCDELYDAIDASDTEVVPVDCSGVTFMDSSGYHALADASEYAVRQDHILALRNLSPHCERVIRLCDQGNDLHLEILEALT